MNFKFSKMISVVCVLAMLLSCFSSITMYADAAVQIVTAEYDVYDGELRVLAKLPEDGASGAVVTACGAEVSGGSWMEQGDYMLFTKTGYTPATLGVCNVSVTCGAVSDSVNVRFMKSFGKAESLEENFNAYDATSMTSYTDDTVKNLLASTEVGDTDVTLTNLPHSTASYNNKYLHIKSYNDSDGNAAVFQFDATAAGGLPNLICNPATDAIGGVTELEFDIYTTNVYARVTLYGKNTSNSDIYFNGASSYQLLHHNTQCFGDSDVKVKADRWYNLRVLLNLDEFKFELYVDNMLVDEGTLSYKSGATGIFGAGQFSIAPGVQGKASASATNPVEVAVDNIKITNTAVGAIPSAVIYNAQGSEEATAVTLTDAEIPYPVATDMTVNLSRTIGYSEGNIAVKTAAGADTGATVSVTDDGTRSALAVDTSSLTPGEYKIVLSKNVTFSSAAYGAETVIPFTVVPTLALISPASGMSVKKGDKALIKACTPDAGKVSIYIDDALLVSQAPDSVTKLVSAECDTTDLTLGTHEVTLLLEKADGSVEYLRSSFVVNEVKETVITPLDTFETFVDMNDDDTTKITENLSPYALDYFLGQNNADAALKKELRDDKENDNAVSVYYTRQDKKLNSQSAVFIQDDFTAETGGRIVLEHDLYIESGTINYGLSYKETVDGVSTEYNFYPMEDTTFIGGGTIGGVAKPYNDGQWHTIKVVVDFILGQTEAYFDGEYVGSGELTSSKGDVPGFERIRLTYKPANDTTQGTESFAFAVDNWRVYKELPVPVVDSITAGGAAAEENGVISSTDTFAVTFAGKYTYSALDSTNVSLLVNGVASDGTEVSYDKATNTLAVKAANAVPAHSDVQIIIDDSALLYDAATAAGADTAINLKVCDSGGLYANRAISKIDSTMVLSAKLDAASERSVTLIFATYNGNRLVNIDTEEVLVDGAKNITLTLPAAGASDARAFIWDSFTSLIPQIGVTGPVAAN